MPEVLAPSNRNVSSLQRWQSLKTGGGCMGAFSQMLHLNKMLGGSNDCLGTTDARAQSLRSKTGRRDVDRQSSLQLKRTNEPETSIDLRKFLDVKQEPFVLQEVIWEKKHPIRTRSSRELKFDLNDMVASCSKSQHSKRAKSKDRRRHSDVGCDADSSEPSDRHRGASSALVMGYNVPAESMVTLPSPQNVRKTRPSSAKAPSAGKSPVKSPNKKALLMEAAAKILEGSNRRASSSARSLLRELDGSKQAQELSKLKEARMTKAPLGVEPTAKQKTRSEDATTSEQNREEFSKQHSNVDKSFRFLNQSQQDLIALNSFEITEDEVLMVMQSRIYPSDVMPAARGELSQPAATTADHCDASQHYNHSQCPNAHFSMVDRTAQSERLITLLDVSEESMQRTDDLRPEDERMVSEVLGRQHRQWDMSASGDRQDLQSAPYADSSDLISINELPPGQELVNSLEWNTPPEHAQVEIQIESHIFSMSRGVPIDETDCSINIASSGNSENWIGDIHYAHSCTFSDVHSNGHSKSYTSRGDKPCISGELCMDATESDTTAKATPPVLLLCNYSWWTQEEIQDHSCTLKNETSNKCDGYDSPLVATRGPCVVKIFEERKEVGNLEEESSISSDHSYAEEFQQSSPVSVLDMVYDNSPVLAKPFDYFDEARQKLLESVRRYEMLAHMDLDTLIKINEDSLEFEEESDSSSFKESWGSDVTDTSATHHQVPSMASPDYQLSRYGGFVNVDVEGLGMDHAYGSHYEASEDDLYIHSDEDFYMQQLQEVADEDGKSTYSDFKMDARARFQAERESTLKALLDCAIEPSDLHTSKGPRRRCSRTNSSPDTFNEVESLTGSVVITALLHMDMATSSWSSFHEEVEVMEIELESSLFAALMQELFSDLL